jgi:aconitate hydratase
VGKFVEYAGPGLSQLGVADRATLSNMSPEYGATAGLFPVDAATLEYLRMTNRPAELIHLVERYTKEQGLFRTDDAPMPEFSEMLELDLSTVEPSMAGPRRPQDRVSLSGVPENFRTAYPPRSDAGGGSGGGTAVLERNKVEITLDGLKTEMGDGSVAIAAITSCTNTSNPSVMVAAGLLAKKAVERGLTTRPWVKTSLAPGSRVVTDYLEAAELLPYLEALRFHVVGYGCTTCIGNSGPLLPQISEAIQEHQLVVASVLSGNRNFEGRIHPEVRASYLASPPLVVAYALAGSVEKDLTREPLGTDPDGKPVYLWELWPTPEEVQETIGKAVTPNLFAERYGEVFTGDERWASLPVPEGSTYAWDDHSTYVREPSFFQDLSPEPKPIASITGARVLARLGDSITTDHISPAGSIPLSSPAGQYLVEHGVERKDFNSYGARRGNHEVMVRGTFGNIRLRNELTPDKEGDWTVHFPSGETVHIFEASERYAETGTPLVVLAGKEYGSGSSRDWAAKGPLLLGVRAVIAEGYERIHRSNLVAMGILPLQFKDGETRDSLGLTGEEELAIPLSDDLKAGSTVTVNARRADGSETSFETTVRIDSAIEVEYYRHGGVLPFVLRRLLKEA